MFELKFPTRHYLYLSFVVIKMMILICTHECLNVYYPSVNENVVLMAFDEKYANVLNSI